MDEQTTAAQGNTETATESAEQTTTVESEQTEQSIEQTETTDTKESTESAEVVDTLADYQPTFPEGFAVNEELMGDFMTAAKELKATPEQADKMVAMGCQVAQKAVEDFTKALNEQCPKNYKEFIESQGKDVEKDVGNINQLLKKYGGDDAAEAFHAALTALSAYGNDAMKPLFSALKKMGSDFADPNYHFGQPAPQKPKSLGDVLYGKNK